MSQRRETRVLENMSAWGGKLSFPSLRPPSKLTIFSLCDSESECNIGLFIRNNMENQPTRLELKIALPEQSAGGLIFFENAGFRAADENVPSNFFALCNRSVIAPLDQVDEGSL
jgi:hypothetical protein